MCRKSFNLIFCFFAAVFFIGCESTKSIQPQNSDVHLQQTLQFRFASESEGSKLITSYPNYFNSLNSMDISWRFKSATPKTVEDYKQLRQSCVKEWNPEHIRLCEESIFRFLEQINKSGFILPETPEIIFIETSMKEEMGAIGYTHNNNIYLGYDFFEEILNSHQKDFTLLDEIISHELFHCFTTYNSEFRKQVYSIIDFKIDETIKLNKSITSRILTNPDVPKHDSHAIFTIDGQKRDCVVVCLFTDIYRNKYSKEQAFEHISTALVPLDQPDTFYYINDPKVSDFNEVMGHNTGYTIDPEECLADNFSLLITLGVNNPSYLTQSIIDKMADILCKGNY